MSRPPGLPRTGGRKKGTLDKTRRFQLTERMARDILATYRKLGGQEFLLKFAKENPKEFVQQCLGRLMPAPYKEDPDVLIQQQFNTSNLSDFEIAQRIAYTLNKGMHSLEEDEIPRVVSPQEACRAEPEIPQYDPVEEPEPEPIQAGSTLETYVGSSEQHQSNNRKPSLKENRRLL